MNNKEIIKATVLKFDEVNLNGRMYSKECFESILGDFNHKCDKSMVFGQIGYPDNFDVNLSNASHKVHNVSIDKEKNEAIAEISFLDNDSGKLLKELYDTDQIVFRPRGTGTIDSSGNVDLKQIFSFDAIQKDQDSFKNIL